MPKRPLLSRDSIGQVVQLRPEAEVYLTRRQVAERLNVGLSTLDKYVREGMPSYQWSLRIRRFKFSEVERWLRARDRTAA
jgi:excisionase family DNA binding protein